MNNIFSDFLDVCVMIYLDYLLIYSNNMSKYHQHIKEVLKHLCKASFYAKAEKCEFYSESVEYLEYILSPLGLILSNDKVKIIQDWLEPKKVKNIQSFLEFTNFYHWLIFNYLGIVIPLTCLTQKDIPWKFDSVRHGSHWGGSSQNRLGDEQTCGTTLALAYVLCRLSVTWSQLQMMGRKSEWE